MATPSTTGSVALDSGDVTLRARGARWAYVTGAGLLLLAASFHFAEVRPATLFQPSTMRAVAGFLAGLSHPDLTIEFLRVVGRALIQTVATAIAGTLISVIVALPLSVLATATLWSRGVLISVERSGLSLAARRFATWFVRAVLGFLRAVPDLVWALLFVAAIGLGPLAGSLALAVAYTGVLGRVYADVFEHVDPRPLEALQSTGATRLQIFLRGVWPQALPHLTAYSLYSFECCVRAAAVLGFVGAGGIGYEISISMRLFEYGQVTTLLLVLIALLTSTDALSRHVRSRFLSHEDQMRLGSARGVGTKTSREILRALVFLAVTIASFGWAGFTPHALSASGIGTRLFGFAVRMLPPDLGPGMLSGLGSALVQTVAISVVGTAIGIALTVILSLPATSTLTLLSADAPGHPGLTDRSVRWIAYWCSKSVLNILRAIPELVWVLMFIVAVGIGPFAGALALGLHTAGVLGKLYAETMEEVPKRPLEALRALGARPGQILLWAILPQARPLLTSYTVLRWEMNLRASTVLGLVGGGGLGQAIYNNIQLGFYPRVSTLICLIYVLVLASDWVGERLRWRVA